jgi:hypothetical protein
MEKYIVLGKDLQNSVNICNYSAAPSPSGAAVAEEGPGDPLDIYQ